MKPTIPTQPRLGRRLSLAQVFAPANNQGLTLIECLVAIIMVALVASAITPALVLSVATRVQSQKAEQAMALGQAEVDRVRTLVERGDLLAPTPIPATPPPSGPFFRWVSQIPVAPPTVTETTVQSQVGAARGTSNIVNPTSNPNGLPATPTQTRQFDINNDDIPDFVVQVYRTRGIFNDLDQPVAFALGVRVYDYDAVATGSGNMETEPLSLGITGGSGQRGNRPIAAFYTTVAQAEQGDSLCELIRYSQSTTGIVASVPLGCAP